MLVKSIFRVASPVDQPTARCITNIISAGRKEGAAVQGTDYGIGTR